MPYIPRDITTRKLNKYVTELEKTFEITIFRNESYKILKNNGEKLLKYAIGISPGGIPFLDSKDYSFKEATQRQFLFRIFLGLACELIVKAAFLKEGYSINKHKRGRLRLIRMRRGFENKIRPGRVHNQAFLLKEMRKLFPSMTSEQYNGWVRKGFEIARIWRNKEVHIGGGYHRETIADIPAVYTSIVSTYQLLFDEEQKVRKILEDINTDNLFFNR